MIHVSGPPFHAELIRRALRFYAFEGLFNSGVLSAGAFRTINPPRLSLSSGASVGAQKMGEACESNMELMTGSPATGVQQWWTYPMHADVVISLNTSLSPAAGSSAGFSLGSAGAVAFPANPAFGLIALQANLLTFVWELVTAKGNGTAAVTTNLVGVNAPVVAPFDAHRIRLDYVPGSSVTATVDGVVGAVYTGAAIPVAGAALNGGFGASCYVRTAANVGDQTVADFYTLTAELIGRI